MSAIPITSPTPAAADRVARVPAPTADGAFGRTLSAASAENAPVAATDAIEPALLAHLRQQQGAHRDRDARKRGRELIEALAALQHALLADGDRTGSLAALARLLDDIPQAADPALSGIVREIEVRAAVELARQEPAAQHAIAAWRRAQA